MAKLSLNSNLKSSNNEPSIILRKSFLPSSSASSTSLSSSTIWIIFLLLSTLLLIIFGYYFIHYLDVWIIQTKRTSSPLPSEILNLPSRTFVPLELSGSDGEQLLLNDYNQNQQQQQQHNYLDDDQRLEAEAKIDEAKDYYDDDDDDDDDNYEDTYLKNDGSSTILYNGTIYDSIHSDEDLDHQHQNVSNNNNNNNNNKNSLEKQQKKHYYHHKHKRFKRGVLGLASMIRCITNCNPLSYKNYGCFCGFQGEGRPVDSIDRCCYMHDLCYTRTDCNQVLVYFTSYKWMCHRDGRASCGYVVNGSSQDQCGYQLCECDRRFAKCLRRYRCPKGKPSCRTKRNTILDIAKLLAI